MRLKEKKKKKKRGKAWELGARTMGEGEDGRN
jgi:hypothetical protein